MVLFSQLPKLNSYPCKLNDSTGSRQFCKTLGRISNFTMNFHLPYCSFNSLLTIFFSANTKHEQQTSKGSTYLIFIWHVYSQVNTDCYEINNFYISSQNILGGEVIFLGKHSAFILLGKVIMEAKQIHIV